MADTPRSNASSTYDLEDSFLAQGKTQAHVGAWKSDDVLGTAFMCTSIHPVHFMPGCLWRHPSCFVQVCTPEFVMK